jgi:phenylpyruvate tautomerase PptA (4-oxalocrotonate tautomerase family)
MPLVRISFADTTDPALAVAAGDAVHRAMVATINVPVDDKFQVLTRHEPAQLVYAQEYLGIAHTSALTIIQITLNAGRTLEQKKLLYATIADFLSELGIPRSDVIINVVEVVKENWSFGDGIAQYAPEN